MTKTYTVKSGDTLSKIANQYGVSIEQITGFKSGNPNLIYPGEVLTVGSSTPVSTSQPSTGLGSLAESQRLEQAASKITGIQPVLTPLASPPSPISDTADIRRDNTKLYGDIISGLKESSLEPPEVDIDKLSELYNAEGLQKRQEELKTRKEEDITQIGKEFTGAEEELRLSQEEELAKAEGRTRIGGFFTQFEAQDIVRLQRGHRLELSALRGQKQQVLQQARRAYEDADYALARDQAKLAKDIEDETYKRRQDYFNNLIKVKNLNTPVTEANEAIQNQVIDFMEKYPDAFTDIDADELSTMTLNDAYKRVLKSEIYKKELQQGPEKGTEFERSFFRTYGRYPTLQELEAYQRRTSVSIEPEVSTEAKDYVNEQLSINPLASEDELVNALRTQYKIDTGDAQRIVRESRQKVRFIDEDFIRSMFTEDQLKTAAKEAGFTKGGFLGIGVGKKGIQDYIDNILEGIESRRASGVSDFDILKEMQ